MMRQSILIGAALAAVAFAAPAIAVPPGFARHADALLNSSYPADGPGASVIVTEHGKIVYQGTRGLADLAAKRRITPATVFKIGSMTKQFAAATILQLAAENKIKLSEPIERYLPNYPNGRAITIAHLLNHTSGVQDYLEIPGWVTEANIARAYTTQQLIAEFQAFPAHSKPGEKWAYTNSGYILVGALIEAVTHKPWYHAIDERIFRPLALSSMGYGGDTASISALATGYTQGEKDQTMAMRTDMSVAGAAGALVGTPSDLAVWADALHHGRVVKAPFYAQMIAPTILADGSTVPYAFGLENGDVRGHPTIGHGGEIFGFTTFGLYVPGNDLFVAVYSNSDGPQTPVETTTRRLVAMAVGSPYVPFVAMPFDVRTVEPMLGVYQFKDAARIFGMRDGKLFTKRDGGTEMPVFYAGQNHFFYGPSELSWFAVRKDVSGKFIFERHANGSDEIDAGILTAPGPTRN
jgi:D-alanyl-D-alanine carboxypeptidase